MKLSLQSMYQISDIYLGGYYQERTIENAETDYNYVYGGTYEHKMYSREVSVN